MIVVWTYISPTTKMNVCVLVNGIPVHIRQWDVVIKQRRKRVFGRIF
jgi:hypothetical protein